MQAFVTKLNNLNEERGCIGRQASCYLDVAGHKDRQDAMSALKSVLRTGPVSHVEKHFHYGSLTVCVRLAYSYSGGT